MLFEDIELLIVLSEAKSLSQAADQLFMSRPGLSQRISNFEKRVGRKLFERTSTGITPTKAGELVVNFARNTASLERVLASQLATTSLALSTESKSPTSHPTTAPRSRFPSRRCSIGP